MAACLFGLSVFAAEDQHHQTNPKARGVETEKPTNMGSEIDVYVEYDVVKNVTLFLGEELTFANFLTPENGLFDACNTVIGAAYTPHPNIALEAAYEFLYANATCMNSTMSNSST